MMTGWGLDVRLFFFIDKVLCDIYTSDAEYAV